MSKYPTGGIKTFKDGHEEYWCEYCHIKIPDNQCLITWNGKIICEKCDCVRENEKRVEKLLEEHDEWGAFHLRELALLRKYVTMDKKNKEKHFNMIKYGNNTKVPCFKEFAFIVSVLCNDFTSGDFICGKINKVKIHNDKTDSDFIGNFVSIYEITAEKDGYRFGDIKP